MGTAKTIAKVIDIKECGTISTGTLLRVDLDCDVPGIIFADGYYTKGPVRYIGVCKETSPYFAKGDLIEITSTFYEKGQEYNGQIIKNYCYLRTIKVVE